MTQPKFGLIVADPPWRYRNFTDAVHGAAASHYDTMAHADLCALPVKDWADDSCVLAMWATWPLLDEAVAVLAAWGFEFKTGFPWVKTLPQRAQIRRGIGFWVQSASELVLIGTRGTPQRAREREHMIGLLTGDARQFYAPIAGHSTKPPELQAWLAAEFPGGGARLELFARRNTPGWTCWGRDTGFVLSSAGVEAVALPASASMPLFDGRDSPQA